jgi:hypothetical protein
MEGKGMDGNDDDYGEFSRRRARAAKEAGMDLVRKNSAEFALKYFDFVLRIEKGWVGTTEDIRRAWPYELPHHVNCWGANANAVHRAGLLEKTGQQKPPAGIKSHGRPIYIYRRT